MSEKLRVGILGGTGMVGQRFIALLADHPWFEVTTIAASPRSAGKTYGECVEGRWKLEVPMPEAVRNIVVKNVKDVDAVASEVDFCFSAVDMSKDEIKAIEEEYAKTETPVVSNNSAHRWTPDVPMIQLLHPELYPRACRMEGIRALPGSGLYLPGNLRRRQDFPRLARDERQHYPLYRRRGREERTRAPSSLRQDRKRCDRSRRQSHHHQSVHPCACPLRPHRHCIRQFQKEGRQRGTHREAPCFPWTSPGTAASQRSRKLHSVPRRGQPSPGPAGCQLRARLRCLHRQTPPRHPL